MIASTVPTPPMVTLKTEIIFRSDLFYIEKITHQNFSYREPFKRERYEIVHLKDAPIKMRETS